MRKLDRYILKKFIITFLFCMLLFTVIAVAVDSSEKTDDFVKANLGTRQILTEYYLGFIPYIWNLLFPLFVFIAVIFFTSKMALRSEVIAILASGTSYNRFLRPYLLGGLMFAVILFLGSHYWFPRANVIRSDFQANYLDKNDPLKNRIGSYCENCFYKRLDSNTFVGFRNYDTLTQSARGFFMEKVKENRLVYNLRAESIKWDTAVRQWKLFNAAERFIDSAGERMQEKAEMHLLRVPGGIEGPHPYGASRRFIHDPRPVRLRYRLHEYRVFALVLFLPVEEAIRRRSPVETRKGSPELLMQFVRCHATPPRRSSWK